jgi:protein SCO1/2
MKRKTLGIILASALVALIVVTGYNSVQERLPNILPDLGQFLPAADVGGPFTAITHEGTPISEKSLLGEPHAIFFGFTHCPDICPTTLAEASNWIEQLGEKGEDLTIYFATVDPTRDDAQVLADYISPFSERIIGITGTADEMAQMARQWRIFFRKLPLEDDDYTMDHTATVFLMNADGSFSGTIDFGEEAARAVSKLESLVERNP